MTSSERTYVGTSELLSREAMPGGGVDSRTYTYDSQGVRLGAQVDRGQTSPRFDAYSHDANGSVVGIEDDDDGEIEDSDRYLYDPYGALLDTDPGNGDRYYDLAHGTVALVSPGGFASGKTLQVATDPLTGRLVTVIDKSPSFVPDPVRYVPLGPPG